MRGLDLVPPPQTARIYTPRDIYRGALHRRDKDTNSSKLQVRKFMTPFAVLLAAPHSRHRRRPRRRRRLLPFLPFVDGCLSVPDPAAACAESAGEPRRTRFVSVNAEP